MSLNPFFTNISPQGGQNIQVGFGEPSSQGALGGDLGAGLGLNFVDLILARLTTSDDNGRQPPPENDGGEALPSDNPLLEKTPTLDLARLLADNPEIAEEIEAFESATQLGEDVVLGQTLALNQQAFDEILKPLVDELSAQLSEEELETFKTQFSELLIAYVPKDAVQDVPEIQEAFPVLKHSYTRETHKSVPHVAERMQDLLSQNDPALINVNFTPEQITNLKTLIEGIAEITTENIQADNIQTENIQNDVPLDTGFVSQFFTVIQLVQPARPPGIANILSPHSTSSSPAGELALFGDETDGQSAFEILLRHNVKTAGAHAPGKNGIMNLAAQGHDPQTSQGAVLSQAQMSASPLPYFDLNAFGMFEMTPQMMEELGLSPLSQAGTQTASLTHLITHAPQASAQHPATQMVAASIMKNAGAGGENTQFTIQLDPPDLGRIEVQMSFGKDKSVKAVLMIEKPETYMMLQRDAQTLERTLQDMGLDLEDGVGFELAEQGFDFDRGNERGGGHDAGGTGAGGDGEDALEIIETTMTWQVDPDSGHVRYDIWA